MCANICSSVLFNLIKSPIEHNSTTEVVGISFYNTLTLLLHILFFLKVTLLNVIKAKNDRDIYLVFEHMDTDLHVAKRVLLPVHVGYIIYQCLKAVHYMHSGGVIHRDLKPANILVNEEAFCMLADFGLARSIVSTQRKDDA